MDGLIDAHEKVMGLRVKMGLRVTFTDLVGRADLNGKCGVISVEAPDKSGQLTVQVVPGNEVVAVLPKNLVCKCVVDVAPTLRDHNDECPICMEPLSGAKVKVLRCGHGMHYVPCFTRFIGNTVGTWVHEPGRVDPNPEVKIASLGLCLSCPICRDFAPYVFIADSDTTLEFRECVMELASRGAEFTFCQMHEWLRDYRASGLPLASFMESLNTMHEDEDEDIDLQPPPIERPLPRTFQRPVTVVHASKDDGEDDASVVANGTDPVANGIEPVDFSSIPKANGEDQTWHGNEVLACYYY